MRYGGKLQGSVQLTSIEREIAPLDQFIFDLLDYLIINTFEHLKN